MQITKRELQQIIKEELEAVLDEKKGKKRKAAKKKKRKKKKKSKGKKDACYHKVKSRYKVWPSAYASGALVKCRKKGAKNWGNSKKNESLNEEFSTHDMYDPKTGRKYVAKVEADHVSMAKKGYVHVDPKKIEKILRDEGGAAGMDPFLKEFGKNMKDEILKALKAMPSVAKHEDGDYILDDDKDVNLQEGSALDQQILSRSDYMRGLLNFIEQNPGTTSDEMFNSDVANAIIPIGIRDRAIILWIKQLIKDGYITSKRYRLYTTGKASWNNHNVVTEKKKKAVNLQEKKNCGCGRNPCKTYGRQ